MLNTYQKVGDSIDLSGTNSATFSGVSPYPNINFQYVWSSMTGAASFKLQASNDNSNWDDTGHSGTTSGASGSDSWQLDGFSAAFYRVLVTSTATAGTLVVTASGNGA